jgi:hypothetical protein
MEPSAVVMLRWSEQGVVVNLAVLARIDPERVEEGNKAFGENPISDYDEVSAAIARAGLGAAEFDAGIRFYRCRAVGGIQPFAKITHESARLVAA